MKLAAWLAHALLLACAALTGCERIDTWLHPYDDTAAVRTTPPLPGPGNAQLYAAADSAVSLQWINGDCAMKPCFVFSRGKWKALPTTPSAEAAPDMPLLAEGGATGSAYADNLWTTVGKDRAILINAAAGKQNLAAGRFDGLRVGLSQGGRKTYVTVYADSLCKGDRACWGYPAAASIYIHGDKAWLLQQADGHLNLVDLFALLGKPTVCGDGIIIDTAGTWAGPVETALSPDLFISRAVLPAAAKAQQDRMVAACSGKTTKS